MKNVVIFGLNDFAELAHYYLTHDSKYTVVAFAVHQEFLPKEKTFKDLPIVAFEDVEKNYSPSAFLFFAPMAPKKMNALRKAVYLEAKRKGYQFISYVSSKATLFDNDIGENCFILEDNTIQPFTSIGNNVIMWSGNHIGHHCVIKDHVMFTSHVVLSGHCVVESQCFFGVNATIRDGLALKEGTLVAMSASIVKNTDPWSVYVGNPAKKIENKHSQDVAL